ncbi:AMP-binding protein [Tsukamurella sp. 1534]|uniref:AMP-binding protein n=1 Tax=Tsukamurella sp. 1534 TaxID=1151061 RepID=UPI000308B2B7|nr:AMP-binding protein [Tsukamurella sp. 1534]
MTAGGGSVGSAPATATGPAAWAAGTATTRDLLERRAEDHKTGLLFEGASWTWAEFVAECRARAHLLLALRDPERPFHVGVMLENHPEYLFHIGAAAYAGATAVGVNLTRTGADRARDVRNADCQILITDAERRAEIDGHDHGVEERRIVDVADPAFLAAVDGARSLPGPDVASAADPATRLLLLFTSGSTGDPKAVICSTGRLAAAALFHMGIGREDVSYNAMPLFHGNAILACWANPLATGGTFALARRFSASGFVDDLLATGATFFNYVGRSLAYVLAQPERPEERRTRLRACFGTEASERDRAEFERRFGVRPTESYGSSEGGVVIRMTDDTPPGALGVPPAGMRVEVVDPATLEPCPRARFDDDGRLLNAGEAIGEFANPDGAPGFEGYYRNPAATAERIRGSLYLTGDLGYRDEAGFFYFAGRGADRLRVDSENFSAAPIERILGRHPGVRLAAVFPVPDAATGDQVMAVLQVDDPGAFDPGGFARFLAAQPDLAGKWAPRYVRVTDAVPVTATRKIDKKALRAPLWEVPGVLLRPGREVEYRPLTGADRAAIRAEFAANGRSALVPDGGADDPGWTRN